MKKLTHICLLDFSVPINSTSPFPILGVTGVFFFFFFVFKKFMLANSVDTDQTLRSVASGLIWVYTVCLGPRNVAHLFPV